MNIKKLSFACIMSGLMAFNASAGSIDASAARQAASDFLKKNMTSKGMLKAPTMADIKLAYSEASKVEGNAYYVFNIDGGGWVIVAGDDRAKQVLAYGTEGNIDMANMPASMKGYLSLYKDQIEFMQAYKGDVRSLKVPKRANAIEPMLKSTWGQDEPMDRWCPMVSGEHAAVGCGPLAMAQIMD